MTPPAGGPRHLTGPYQHRVALDEVVQMMGGLFGAIGALGALFENNVFLVGQHMLQYTRSRYWRVVLRSSHSPGSSGYSRWVALEQREESVTTGSLLET